MTPDDETEVRILEKAAHVETAVEALADKRSLDRETYLNDREQRAIVEREFQTAIEACIDVAELLIREGGEEMPSTNARKFTSLERAGVLGERTAEKMRDAAGFRNILAHSYGLDIDDEQVYHHLQHDLGWFPAYLSEVRDHLRTD